MAEADRAALQCKGFDPTKATNTATARNLGKVGGLPVVLIEGDRAIDRELIPEQEEKNEIIHHHCSAETPSAGIVGSTLQTVEQVCGKYVDEICVRATLIERLNAPRL